MKRVAAALAGLGLAFGGLAGQAPVEYDVSFPDAAHHLVRITMTVRGLDPDSAVTVVMPRSSPGRYAIHDFAKNVFDVSAVGGSGDTLTLQRITPDEWRAAAHRGTVSVSYTVFGDHADGTYLGVDSTHAHFNMPAAFMFPRDRQSSPIRIRFQPVHGWKVATQLPAVADSPNTFTAPDLQYFMDSPTELSDYALREWREGGATFRLVLHHAGTPGEADRYADMARRVVAEERAVFGELAPYDYGTYTFLVDYLPWVYGDGMEHRNSTLITSTRPLGTSALANLGTLAHEFFHSWNMERIRSKELEPFDFEHADMSGELWFGEGFTNYYGHLALWRAGIIDDARFGRMEGSAAGSVMEAPGKRFFTPVEMSEQAPYVDAAVSIDPTNHTNTFISYYTWGEVIALGLDLTLRSRYPGVTLDDLMREMWRTHGSPEVPYDNQDIEAALARVTSDPDFAKNFFDRYVFGHEVQDFAPLLAAAGFELVRANPGRPTLGLTVRTAPDGRGMLVVRGTRLGTPAYEAGLDLGDVLLAVDGHEVSTTQDVAAALSSHAPGDSVVLRYESRGETRQARVSLQEDPNRVAVPVEVAGGTLSDSQRRFRAEWKRGAEGGGAR